ncbi:hypothetical protein QCA50_019166 [Cerrena zonata]|uniref:Uncharacterized protein n=1 Tax=Cerrena zonata TaxID=2478898 RepID=A0AAW0FG17_9APHY
MRSTIFASMIILSVGMAAGSPIARYTPSTTSAQATSTSSAGLTSPTDALPHLPESIIPIGILPSVSGPQSPIPSGGPGSNDTEDSAAKRDLVDIIPVNVTLPTPPTAPVNVSLPATPSIPTIPVVPAVPNPLSGGDSQSTPPQNQSSPDAVGADSPEQSNDDANIESANSTTPAPPAIPSLPVQLPIQNATLPIQNATVLIQNVTLPIQNTTLPIQNTSLPIQIASLPIQNATLPIQNVTLPIQNTTLPIENTPLSILNTTVPVSNITLPTPDVQTPNVTLPITLPISKRQESEDDDDCNDL